jgi:ribonuclease P protein component
MAGTPTVRFRFPRASRIKQGGGFARARAEGRRVVCGCLIANVLARSEGSAHRLGVVTSKKIGNAVARSRARRLLRETFRLHQHDFKHPLDLVLVARPSITGKKFAQVEVDFLRALRQARVDDRKA